MKLLQRYDYEMPHLLDRTGQMDAFEAMLKFLESDKQYFIFSAPTGLGKTGIIAELTKFYRIMALVRTKVLQEAVYAGDYQFDLIKGKINYPCAYSPETHRADVCGIPSGTSKRERYEICEGSSICQYHIEMEKLCASARASTTYAKYISDRQPYNSPNIYAFDEAHDIPELVIEQSGFGVNVNRHMFLHGFGSYERQDTMTTDDGLNFMRKIYHVASNNKPKLNRLKSECTEGEIIKYKRQVMRHTLFLQRVEATANYVKAADREGINIWHESITGSGDFTAKPMTAAYHFKRVLGTGAMKTILMSATISPLVAEFLGITEDEFDFYEAPQQYPVSMRPVWDLGQSGMGKKKTDNSPSLWNLQAIRISNILKLRPDVSSVILVTSKEKAKNLAMRLLEMGHDTFVPPMGIGTDRQLYAWERYRKPGAVCISYNFWEGVSLSLDHMLFIAGMRYPDLRSPFERARLERSPKEFNYRTAVQLVQGAGRIQRGFLHDYLPVGNIDNLVGKMVFLVDGNYTRLKSFAPGDFAERILPWPG